MISFNLKIKNLPVEAESWATTWAWNQPEQSWVKPDESHRFVNVPAQGIGKPTVWYYTRGRRIPNGYLPDATLEDGKTYVFDVAKGQLEEERISKPYSPWTLVLAGSLCLVLFLASRIGVK